MPEEMKNLKNASLESNRLVWADTIKGIAIWLMVFCHANVSDQFLLTLIYMFHMPVFFIISGYFDRGNMQLGEGVKHAFRKLIIPYFIYSILGFSICWVSPYLHPELYEGIDGFPAIFKAAFVGMIRMDDSITSYSIMPQGCLWFLVALFVCKLLWLMIRFIWHKTKLLLVFPLALMIIIGMCHPTWFSLDSAVYAFPFYVVGVYMRRKQHLSLYLKNNMSKVMLLILSITYMLTLGMVNGKVNIDSCEFGDNLMLFYIGGLAGFFSCYCASELMLNKFTILSEIGKVSLTILGTHLFVCIIGKSIAVALFHQDAVDFPLIASFLIACASCSFAVWIKRLKFFRWLP